MSSEEIRRTEEATVILTHLFLCTTSKANKLTLPLDPSVIFDFGDDLASLQHVLI